MMDLKTRQHIRWYAAQLLEGKLKEHFGIDDIKVKPYHATVRLVDDEYSVKGFSYSKGGRSPERLEDATILFACTLTETNREVDILIKEVRINSEKNQFGIWTKGFDKDNGGFVSLPIIDR